jgi:hypothetical protein
VSGRLRSFVPQCGVKRYQLWCPWAHFGTSFTPARRPGAKPFWGAAHYPDGVPSVALSRAFRPRGGLLGVAEAQSGPDVADGRGGEGGKDGLGLA